MTLTGCSIAGVVGWIGLVRREAWEAAGRFDPELQGFEDWDFTLGALGAGWRGKRLDLVVLDYRKHGRSGARGRPPPIPRALPAPSFQARGPLRQGPRARAGERPRPRRPPRLPHLLGLAPGSGFPRARGVLAALQAAGRPAARRRACPRGGAALDGGRGVPRLGRPRRLRHRRRRGQHPRRTSARPRGQRRLPGHLQPHVHPGGPGDRRPRDRGRVDARIRAVGPPERPGKHRVRGAGAGNRHGRDRVRDLLRRGRHRLRRHRHQGRAHSVGGPAPRPAPHRLHAGGDRHPALRGRGGHRARDGVIYVAGVAAMAVAFDLEGAVAGCSLGQVAGAAVALLWWRHGRDAAGEAGSTSAGCAGQPSSAPTSGLRTRW